MPTALPQPQKHTPVSPANRDRTRPDVSLAWNLWHASSGRPLGRQGRWRLAIPLLLALMLAPAIFAQSKGEEKLEHLTIVNARFLDGEGGYPLPPNSSYYPGEHVYIVFHIGGFHVTEYEYKMKVSYRLDFIGPRGEPFSTTEGGEVAQEVYPQDEKWMPVVRSGPRIPFHAESGAYKIVLYAKDELRPQEESRQELTFQVLGKDIGEADKLTVRNFAFQQSEGGEPVESPSYHPGDTLWGSFYITGFGLRQNNSYDVDSRLEVIDSEGEVMFAFTPQEEEGESFYPRRWLPGRFRVDLDKDIPTGEYVLVLSVHDKLGNQESLTRHRFEIR